MSDLTSPTVGGRGSGAAGESSGAGFTGGIVGGSAVPLAEDRGHVVTHHLRVDPSRSMKAITGEVEALLDGLADGPRRSGALLASELVAQVVGRVPDWNSQPVGLTIQLREDAVRLVATGPVTPSIEATTYDDVVRDDPLAEWGRFILDGLADRWGISGDARRDIWAELR